MKRLALAVATVGGAGYAPGAPGTVGSAIGIVVYYLTWHWSSGAQWVLVAAVSAVGIWAAHLAAKHLGKDDPGCVIIDEVAGQLVSLIHLNVGFLGAAAGFLLFRVFDIAKPWPVRQFERLPGGLGIMADDLMAGLYAWLVMRGLLVATGSLR